MAFLENLLIQKYGVPAPLIVGSSRLVDDLKLDGDDAVELFDAFHDAYPFAPGSFAYEQYFNSEGFSLGFMDWLRGNKPQAKRPMTLQMLVDAALCGRWQDEKDVT